MNYTHETLMAYVDGELDTATCAEIEAAAAADAALAKVIARERALRERLRGEYDRVAEEPVPQRLLDALQAPVATPAPTAPRPSTLRRPPATAPRMRWAWPQWAAMAASLVLGAFIGTRLPTAPAPLWDSSANQLVASGELAEVLSVQTARDVAPGAEIRPGLSFRSASGEVCRTFTARAISGLACREEAQWRIELLAAASQPVPGDYRLAGAELPAVILEAVESRMAGDPLGAQEEAALRERGWRD